MTSAASNSDNETSQALNWRDFYELCKPNVVLLMLLTSAIGMFLAVPGMVPWKIVVFGNIGIGLCAAGAAAVNHIVDRRIDAQMARTFNRPVATGRMDTRSAVIFALLMCSTGMAMLLVFTNALTTWLTLASLLGYAVVYTMYLKRATPQNIVIGGLAGAAPPLLGWVAVTGEVHGHALLLVLIIFAWTPPHFWALAIHRKAEYAKVEIPMLPVTHGENYTRLHIMLYTMLLVAVTMMPFATKMFGLLYLTAATVLNVGFVYWATQLLRGKAAGMATFKYSILYLMLLFAAMLVDHYS